MSRPRYTPTAEQRPSFQLPQARGKRKKTDTTKTEQGTAQVLFDRASAQRIATKMSSEQDEAEKAIGAMLRRDRDEILGR